MLNPELILQEKEKPNRIFRVLETEFLHNGIYFRRAQLKKFALEENVVPEVIDKEFTTVLRVRLKLNEDLPYGVVLRALRQVSSGGDIPRGDLGKDIPGN